MEDDVDIVALTIEQYITLIPDDIKQGIVNPKIGDDVEFEINENFMRELRRKLFSGTDDEDTYEHVRTVIEIVDLFHLPGVTHDAIMLRVFPITLKGRALRWKDMLPAGDETLYHAWERYNDLLYQCPLHDLNCQQKVHIFYTSLDISTRKILDSSGFIPRMTPTQALESKQVMADHSHDLYDETITRERINDVLDNVDVIYESFNGKHLTKEYPLKKEDEFQMFVPTGSTLPTLHTAEDLQGDELLHYDAEIELMNLILLSIPNEIYNSVDACTTVKEMWKRVERLMKGTIQNQVDRETYFTNEFDQFVAEPGEALVSQFKKLVNASRAKKLEKSHDPLALVAHTGSSSRNTSSYYVTHPTSVVDYDDEYQQDDVQTNCEDPLASPMLLIARAVTQNLFNPTNNRLRTLSNTRNQAIIQGDRLNIQRRNPGNTYARNYPKPRVRDSKYFMEQMLLAKQDEAGLLLTDEHNDFLFADASRMKEIKELSANISLMARIQPTNNISDGGPSYDFAFISEVQSSSINENKEQMYPIHTKIINSTIGDDQIDSNIIFDEPNGNVNSGSVEKDTHVPDLYTLEQLARNAYKEAEKQ
ncbi:hypothetical protein Tco_1077882 [Tanacetum coccineum]